jgi:hypothetical protein
VACVYFLKVEIKPSVNARMGLWAELALKCAPKQMMVVYVADMESAWHMAIQLSASATRITLEAPVPRAALRMKMVLFVTAMASVSSRIT